MNSNDNEFSASRQKEFAKRLARYEAFNNRFKPILYVSVFKYKGIIKGMIDDHEKHWAFALHHRINERQRERTEGLSNQLFIVRDTYREEGKA